jgi:hypothetical protein
MRYGKNTEEAEVDRLALSEDQSHEFFDHTGKRHLEGTAVGTCPSAYWTSVVGPMLPSDTMLCS